MLVPHELKAREYKLLLDAARFRGEPSELANALWDKKLKPIIERRLDERKSNRPRHKKGFASKRTRRVRFWDTKKCLLASGDYSLRERVDVVDGEEDDASRQLTLKLRTPDQFVAAMSPLSGTKADAETTFEEDIAPLEVAPSGGKSIALAEPRSIRSRFSLSASQSVSSKKFPKSLGSVLRLYPTLADDLRGLRSSGVPDNTQLRSGPHIHEVVLRGAEVDLGQDVEGKFALSLWYFLPIGDLPNVAEISFKCALHAGRMPRGAARRALVLFISLQNDLRGWVNLREASKTALALPC